MMSLFRILLAVVVVYVIVRLFRFFLSRPTVTRGTPSRGDRQGRNREDDERIIDAEFEDIEDGQ
ncbi:MAG: hypothetical protein QHI48_01915 [Bacteroidota bacterium]|nr:hypothetical protein [Bacteroidota bacterium]